MWFGVEEPHGNDGNKKPTAVGQRWVVEESLFGRNQTLKPPRRAFAHTTRRTGIEQMPVACRLAAVEMR
jgi:hypothetical protein